MKTKIFGLVTVIIFSFSLLSCFSPIPVYYLKPLKNKTDWYKGKEFIMENKNDITIFVAFSRTRENYFIFDLEIHNFKMNDVVVSPTEISFDVLKDSSDNMGINKCYSLDPEMMLMTIQNSISEENSSYLNYLSSQAIVGFLDIVTDVATIGTPKTEEELDKRIERNQQQEISSSNREASHINRINELENYYNDISTNALRKTTLKKYDSIRGEIFLPVNRNVNYLKLVIPVGGETFDFIFQQIKYDKNSTEFSRQTIRLIK